MDDPKKDPYSNVRPDFCGVWGVGGIREVPGGITEVPGGIREVPLTTIVP